jgi:ferredoxin
LPKKENLIIVGQMAVPVPGACPPSSAATTVTVTVEVDGRTGTAAHRPGTTLLQTARQLGLSPPSSCESGNCATCVARLVEGAAMMHANNALTDDEVADGWVLTCQAVPTTPSVRVVYGFEEG